MRKLLPLISCLFAILLDVQGQTSISGVINTYIPVTAITVGSGCTTTLPVITVSSTAGLSTTPGASGNKVLIIQMQAGSTGAINNGSTYQFNATFGQVTNYGGAGNYEFALISAISGLNVTLTRNLINTYDVAGKVQIIPVVSYPAGVTTTGIVTGQPWDGNTGGVLVLETPGTITMNHNITMQGLGFRGRARIDVAGACCNTSAIPIALRSAYFWDELSTGSGAACSAAKQYNMGAFKGEGIFPLIPNQSIGRGAWANAGGGGSGHNSGGGGGSNCQRGGQGGYEYGSCSQSITDNMGGLGGYSMPNGATAVFMGGGGGAGHGNDNQATDGANGGGIIILNANSINATVPSLVVNASGNKPSAIAASDGAGGGGGGGSILCKVASFSGNTITVNANGGAGGDNSATGTCHAAGGGGGGGYVSYTTAGPIYTSASGAKGSNTGAGCDPYGAAAGTSCTPAAGLVLNQNLCVVAPIEILSFSGKNYSTYTKLFWSTGIETNSHYFQIFRSEDTYSWESIGTITTNGTNSQYAFTDQNLEGSKNYYYRLLKMDIDGTFDYSETILIPAKTSFAKLEIKPTVVDQHQAITLSATPHHITEVIVKDARGVPVATYEALSEPVVVLNKLSLSTGIYFVKVQIDSGETLNAKFMVY